MSKTVVAGKQRESKEIFAVNVGVNTKGTRRESLLTEIKGILIQ